MKRCAVLVLACALATTPTLAQVPDNAERTSRG